MTAAIAESVDLRAQLRPAQVETAAWQEATLRTTGVIELLKKSIFILYTKPLGCLLSARSDLIWQSRLFRACKWRSKRANAKFLVLLVDQPSLDPSKQPSTESRRRITVNRKKPAWPCAIAVIIPCVLPEAS